MSFRTGDKLRYIHKNRTKWEESTRNVPDGLGIVSIANEDYVLFSNVFGVWTASRFEIAERPKVNLDNWIK